MANVQIDAAAKNAERAFKLISTRLAPLFAIFAADSAVTEVNFNSHQVGTESDGPCDVWITRKGERERVGTVHGITEVTASSAVKELASSMGQDAIASTPSCFVDAKMPGYRFAAVLAPVAANGTTISIRKHSPRVLSLQEYVNQGALPVEVAQYLSTKVKTGANILIGGGTDSGKTTFLNALSREIPQEERVGTIEDTRELSLIVENWVPFETNTPNGVTATLALKGLMRQSIDRIICGELRDGAAADFISSANTGHHGCMATVHCNSAYMALERLEDLYMQGEANWDARVIRRNIARTIQVVAHFKKKGGARRLNELVEVDGLNDDQNSYKFKTIYQHP